MNLKWVRSSYIQNMIQSSSLVWILLGEQGVHDVPEQVAPGVQPGQGALLPRRDHLSQRSYSGPGIDWDLRQKKARRIHPRKYSIFSAVCFTDIRYRIGTFSAARSPPLDTLSAVWRWWTRNVSIRIQIPLFNLIQFSPPRFEWQDLDNTIQGS